MTSREMVLVAPFQYVSATFLKGWDATQPQKEQFVDPNTQDRYRIAGQIQLWNMENDTALWIKAGGQGVYHPAYFTSDPADESGKTLVEAL